MSNEIKTLYDRLVAGEEKLALIGLGYVGMPIAVEFAKHVKVLGFNHNERRIQQYKGGIDPTHEVGDEAIRNTTVDFTSDEKRLSECKFLIVAVPTPIKEDKTPDLFPVENASRIVGRNLVPGSVVVYESTVYPGVTEDVCVPILEKESGLKCGVDFKIGYSPDAEAAKVIENSQRDINIAFMNELSIIFHRLGIDTKEVLEAAGTKWNFLKFYPGLVGGHCIGVDPYYLTYKADMLGYHSQVILAGRRINDGMGKYVAESCVKQLIAADKPVKNAKVAILGFTFKENCPDTRNSKVMDIVNELHEYGITPVITDPVADAEEARRIYGLGFDTVEAVKDMDAVILAVAHDQFKDLTMEEVDGFFGKGKKILLDIKGILDKNAYDAAGYSYWRL